MTLFTRIADLLLGTDKSPWDRRLERDIHTWTPDYKEDPL